MGGGIRDASIGVSVSATISEMITATETVTPNSVRKLPICPDAKATGMNTAATENVAATAAKVISRVPSRAASSAFLPSSRWRSMFSRTMIASSITTPIARVSPSSVIVLSVKSKIQIIPKVVISDIGIAAATIRVGLKRRTKTNTTTTASSPPTQSASIVSSKDSRIVRELSMNPSLSTM